MSRLIQWYYNTTGPLTVVWFVIFITKKEKPRDRPADLVFAPTPACRFDSPEGTGQGLRLNCPMLAAGMLRTAEASHRRAVYVDPFARSWPGFATTDPDDPAASLVLFSLFYAS
ncbi:MAG: hypothetical protein IKX91_00670, partial [Firmicutes bacterium]|nr:hypothetical protein [Bacillota bacterium]